MKHSIKKIFSSLNTYLFFVFFVSFLSMALTFEHQLSFEKVDNLTRQKNIISTLMSLDKKDIASALIQFNGKSVQLHQETDKLISLYQYNYTDQFLFGNADEYLSDLNKLQSLTTLFNNSASQFYTNIKDKSLRKAKNAKLQNSYYEINRHINTLLTKNISYDHSKFNVIKKLVVIVFVLVLLATIWYRNKLFRIYNDIKLLYQLDNDNKNNGIYSIEADAISLRMNRKTVVTDNPTMMDPVTGINNYKGMIHSYSNKKNLKDSNFTSVTIFEIDDFSKSRRTFSQEQTQIILKKVAYAISLHELPIDVIARTDYNQFTLIFSRASKEQSFKDLEIVRQSIAELKFNIQNNDSNNITVSGGFIIKPNNTNIEEALKQAKEILQYAKTTGKNRIFQQRDLIEKDI